MSVLHIILTLQLNYICLFMNRKLTIIFSILLTVLTPLTCLSKQKDVNTSLQKQVEQLLEGKNVQVGIAVYYQGKMLCTKNADQSFPMMSVFKLHQAVAILHCLKQDSLTLKKPMLITKDMLSPDTYSPLRDKYPDGDIRLKVSQLIEYSVAQSDNNASNILFNLFDGTHYANQVIQDLGCTNTQIKWTEDEMAMDHSRAYFNSTTPNDAILLLEMLVDNRTQRQQDFLWLTEVMSGTQTGPNRLAKYLPTLGTKLYHKTGTGYVKDDGTIVAVNDIGFVILPNGKHYSIAVFCKDSKLSSEKTEELIAEISRLTYEYIHRKISNQ